MRTSLNDGLLAYLGRKGREALEDGRELRALLEANDFGGFRRPAPVVPVGDPLPVARHRRPGPLRGVVRQPAAHVPSAPSASTSGSRRRPAHGRADMVVLTGGQVFVLEFKMAEGGGDAEAALDAALAQMRERGYADKYRNRGEPVPPARRGLRARGEEPPGGQGRAGLTGGRRFRQVRASRALQHSTPVYVIPIPRLRSPQRVGRRPPC